MKAEEIYSKVYDLFVEFEKERADYAEVCSSVMFYVLSIMLRRYSLDVDMAHKVMSAVVSKEMIAVARDELINAELAVEKGKVH